MTITAYYVMLELAGKGGVTIDWEDGTLNDKGTLGNNFISYTHSYSSSSTHTITITSANITMLGCSRNQLTSLDVSNNKVLESLNCSWNN
jgi:hypothetical protein